nr:MAG TPA: hypothetical protein [Microviridae sp.]
MLLPLKLLLICIFARSLAVSISNNSSAEILKSTHNLLKVSTLGSLTLFSYLLIASCVNPKIVANCVCDILNLSLFVFIKFPNIKIPFKKIYQIVIF